MPKISIIIPAYNSEKTIKKCIDSVLSQSYKDWELIIINDGSTDNTSYICKVYENNPQIIVLQQENSGVSVARNRGLNYCSGEYVIFLDSDDYLQDEGLSAIGKYLGTADLCYYNYRIIKNNHEVPIDYIKGNISVDIENFLNYFPLLFRYGYVNPPWGKCYKRCLIEQQFQPGISIGEDLLFNLNYLLKCKTIRMIENEVYCYQDIDSDSLSSSAKEKIAPLYFVYKSSASICENFVNCGDIILNCLTSKYIVDQLIEMEKKVRRKGTYRFDDMKNDISYSRINVLCQENEILIIDMKWNLAFIMLRKQNYHLLYWYLKLFKVLGGYKKWV